MGVTKSQNKPVTKIFHFVTALNHFVMQQNGERVTNTNHKIEICIKPYKSILYNKNTP